MRVSEPEEPNLGWFVALFWLILLGGAVHGMLQVHERTEAQRHSAP